MADDGFIRYPAHRAARIEDVERTLRGCNRWEVRLNPPSGVWPARPKPPDPRWPAMRPPSFPPPPPVAQLVVEDLELATRVFIHPGTATPDEGALFMVSWHPSSRHLALAKSVMAALADDGATILD